MLFGRARVPGLLGVRYNKIVLAARARITLTGQSALRQSLREPRPMICPPRTLLCTFAVVFSASVAWSEESAAEHAEFFEKQVRPILVARCQSCHGEAKQEFGLRLDSRASVLSGSDDGPIVVAGEPEKSKLIAAIRYGGDIEMPPKGKLPDEEISVLTRWVELGLPWPAGGDASEKSAKRTGDELYRYARENLWSLQPIDRRALPSVQQQDWPTNAIDVYVLAKLEAQDLSPSPAADRRTLFRRAKFDLLGLPPSAEEVAAFASDDSPDAYERLIDRLLASPAYGERWGRHWLDVARYADTKGYAFGRERKFPFAYTYRDWVIRSLNADMPYDEFVVQQIAADHIDGNPAAQHAALGLLTVGRRFNNDHDDIDDQIDVVTRGFLGLTVACARCHDHKYDAIATEDYYSLYGVFASTTEPKDRPLIASPEESAGYEKYKAELDKRQGAFDNFVNAKHAELLHSARQNVTDYLVRATTRKPEGLLAKFPFLSLNPDELKPALVTSWRQYLLDNAGEDSAIWKAMPLVLILDEKFQEEAAAKIATWKSLPDDKIHPLVRDAFVNSPPAGKEDVGRVYGQLLREVYELWRQAGGDEAAKEKLSLPQRQLLAELLADGSPTNVPKDQLRGYLIRADRNQYTSLEKNIHSHTANSPDAPARAMSVTDKPQPFNPRVFIRGNHHRRGDHVPRQFLRVVAGDGRKPFTNGSGRLELAQAIVDPANPLTARVMVNRVWMHHFGQPLVDSPSDFGMRSQPPAQLEVLDYLASQLIESGWSLKLLHREIMLSATYRQSSGFVERINDPSYKTDPENKLLSRMNRRRLEFEPLRDAMLTVAGRIDATMYGRPVDIFKDIGNRRRGTYAFIDRQELPNLLRAFDFASPDQSAERRPNTTVPQQALFLMNSPFVIEQAKAVVARQEIAQAAEAPARVTALYQLLFTRNPTDLELSAGQQFIAAADENKQPADKLNPWQQYAQLLLLTNEFMFVD